MQEEIYETPKKNTNVLQSVSISSKQNFFSNSQSKYFEKKRNETCGVSAESWKGKTVNENNFTIKIKKLFEFSQKNINILNNIGFHYSSKEMNYQDNKKNSPLFYAVKMGNFDNCLYLINNGADPNLKCSEGNTPVHIAIQNQDKRVKFKFFSLLL